MYKPQYRDRLSCSKIDKLAKPATKGMRRKTSRNSSARHSATSAVQSVSDRYFDLRRPQLPRPAKPSSHFNTSSCASPQKSRTAQPRRDVVTQRGADWLRVRTCRGLCLQAPAINFARGSSGWRREGGRKRNKTLPFIVIEAGGQLCFTPVNLEISRSRACALSRIGEPRFLLNLPA